MNSGEIHTNDAIKPDSPATTSITAAVNNSAIVSAANTKESVNRMLCMIVLTCFMVEVPCVLALVFGACGGLVYGLKHGWIYHGLVVYLYSVTKC